MRQLKYRVWDKKYRRMFPAGTFTLESDGGKVNGFDRAFDGEHSEDENDLTVMEYTGMNDKHGKEIYDGDLLQEVDGDEYGPVQLSECDLTKDDWGMKQAAVCWNIKYKDGSGNQALVTHKSGSGYYGITASECEVIGNTYEGRTVKRKKTKR